MLTSSPNFTVDDKPASLKMVFSYRNKSLGFSRTIFGGVISIIGLAFLIFIAFPLAFEFSQNSGNFSLVIFLSLSLLLYLYSQVNTLIELFWRINGKEIVEINSDGISLCHQVFTFGITKNFSAEKISCIFISHRKDHWLFTVLGSEMELYNFKRGRIGFNSGKTIFGETNTLRFGFNLDQNEAEQVIAIIHRKFPQYKCQTKDAA